jgi:hypothetical protein
MPAEFRPRFPLSEVLYWAARYAYADDAEVEAIGDRARERGWFTRDEFLTVARWKTPRSKSRCEKNDASVVKDLTSTPTRRSASNGGICSCQRGRCRHRQGIMERAQELGGE